ncbi:LrgB family protein [Novosphingobium sp. RD2P27]|uniref:LrgB family protein n=1 Tax=Novosphingobium kalidii TaxID=3230299 RepID=A0ABV2D1R9_9SPHN
MSASPAALIWLVATLSLYILSRAIQRRIGRWWAGPAVTVPPVLVFATLSTGTDYATYLGLNAFWIWLLGPATVAFAFPVWKFRATVRARWRALAACILVGSAVSFCTGLAFAYFFDFSDLLTASLLPRSITSPFAMPFAEQLGGDGKLAALMVILVGIIGGVFGNIMLGFGINDPFARGMMFGVSAHGVGTAFARELGQEEGATAALAMILMGLSNSIFLSVFLMIQPR